MGWTEFRDSMSCGKISLHRCIIKSINLAQPLGKDQKKKKADALDSWEVAADYDLYTFLAQFLTASKDDSGASWHGKLLVGRVASDEHGRDCHADQLFKNCFFDAPTYPGHITKRWYRASERIFFSLSDVVLSVDSYFQQSKDCIRKKGLTTLPQITASMRMLSFGCSADPLNETLEIAERAALEGLYRFSSAVAQAFKEEVLRAPNDGETKKCLQRAKQLGFQRMLGFTDCCKWRWKNFPAAYHGPYKCNKGVRK